MGKIVEELIKGRDWTSQLQILMQMPCVDDVVVSQQKELVDKIFVSLTDAISVMKSDYSGEICQIPASSGGRSRKRPVVKDRMGDSKRRKPSDSWIKISSSLIDEYAWRKYGQKQTQNFAFPRCYFRCTHKHDQGCKATKQVQRVQKEPIKYQVTYFGHHTCRKALQPNLENIILDSNFKKSNFIDFQTYTPNNIYPSPLISVSMKEENKQVQSDVTSEELSLSDSITWPDPMPLMRSNINEKFFNGEFSYASPVDYDGIDMNFFSQCDDFTPGIEFIYQS